MVVSALGRVEEDWIAVLPGLSDLGSWLGFERNCATVGVLTVPLRGYEYSSRCERTRCILMDVHACRGREGWQPHLLRPRHTLASPQRLTLWFRWPTRCGSSQVLNNKSLSTTPFYDGHNAHDPALQLYVRSTKFGRTTLFSWKFEIVSTHGPLMV